MRSGKQRGGDPPTRRDSTDETMESKKFMAEIRLFMAEIRENTTELKGNVNDLKVQMSNMQSTLDQLKVDSIKSRKEIEVNRKEIQSLKHQTEENAVEVEKQGVQLALLEQRQVDAWLRLRGLEEMEEENVHKRVVEMLAKLTTMGYKKMNGEVDKIYRINRPSGFRKKSPRDVIVQFMKQSTREVVMEAYNKKGLEYEGKSVICLREVTGRILKWRRDYEFITSVLKKNQIRFRWERIEGITVTYKGEKFKLNSVDKAKNFLDKFGAEIGRIDKLDCKEPDPRSDNKKESPKQGRNGKIPASGEPVDSQQANQLWRITPTEEESGSDGEEEGSETDLQGAVGGQIETTRCGMEDDHVFGLQDMDLDCIKLFE